MTEPPRLLLAGGYGVFGRVLAREVLAALRVRVVIAGCDARRAARVSRALGGAADSLGLDLADRGAVAAAARGCFAVACTAGPFQLLDPALPRVVADAGAHWLDISDVTGWVVPLLADRTLHAAAVARDTVVMPGLSTLPALSGALVRWTAVRRPDASRCRVGNRNPKGAAAIESARRSGFREPSRVEVPGGPRRAYRFDAPDAVLLRQELGLAGEVSVALEWGMASRVMAVLRRRPAPGDPTGLGLARWLGALAGPLRYWGSPTGRLHVDLVGASGATVRATLSGEGQRMAVLPCVLALEALLTGELAQRGCVHPATWLPPEAWMCRLGARGIRLEATPAGVA